MKKMLLVIFASVTAAQAGEPMEPRTVPSTPRQTLPVLLHTDITTMLVFPEPVSMIVGAGLTDGTTPGLIQFDHRRGSPVVTFRALQADQPAFAQIISGEHIYFCRLGIGDRPDSVVTVAAPKKAAAAVPFEQVVSQRLIFAEERLRQLVELARSAAVLRQVVPDEFEGYQSSLEVSASNKSGPLELRVDQLHRFPQNDSLVIFGTVTNRGNAPVVFQTAALVIRVGESRVLGPNWILQTGKSLKPGESARVECIVAGDGQGNRLHLSIRNRFSLNLVSPPRIAVKDRILDLLKYPSTRVVAIVVLIAALFWIVRDQRNEAPPPSKQQASKLPLMGGGENELKESPVTELMKHFTPWQSTPPPQAVPDKKPVASVETKPLLVEVLPKLIHDCDVVQKSVSDEKVVKPAEPSIPFGSVIACRLFQAVRCGRTAVPVIAELLQPVRNGKGRVWIPQGTHIHGSLHSGSLTGRLESEGSWIFVLPRQQLYETKASLQDRDYDPVGRIYGVNDGTAGIVGTTIKAAGWKRRAVRDVFSVAADATQDRTRTALGEVELGSARNAVLRGVSSLANGAIPKVETGTEPIVSVPAGKEFYLYIEDREKRNAPPGTGEVETMLRERSRLMEQLRQQTGKERQ